MSEQGGHHQQANTSRPSHARGHAIIIIAIALLIGYAAVLRIEHSVLRDEANASAAAGAYELRINLNTATEAELHLLPTIGERLAERIVEDRREHGPFASLDELVRVHGVGRVTIERIAPFVTAEP